jgi:hypothetical protein
MAFNINYIGRASSSANYQALQIWEYNATATGTNEAIATVVAANYFDAFMQDLTDGIGPLQLGDLMVINGNDAVGLYVVSAVSPHVTLASFGANGSIATANIVDLAVTTAKINDLAVTTGKINDLAVTTGKIAAAAVTTAKLSPLTVQYAAVAISAAEFAGMYATPKLLVAAGGANTLIVLDKVDLLMTFVSAAYANGGVAAVQYDSTAHGAGVIASTTLSAATFQAGVSTGFMFTTGVVPQTFSTCVNKGLYLSNITGAFDTGDSTFIAHVWYKVIPTV